MYGAADVVGRSRPVTRPAIAVAPAECARERRNESRTSRRSMAMNSCGFRVLPKSTAMLEGEKMRICVT